MASSKCPKCEKTSFEVALEEPRNSNFKIQFVRCSSCKTVVGVLEFYNSGALIRKLAEKLKVNLDS
jgi:hypothetical protein